MMVGNLLVNPAFDGNLDEWTGTGTLDRADGYPRLGCVQLATGQSISQAQDLGEDQLYTLHYFFKRGTGATLTASYGSISQTHSAETIDVWTEGVLIFALDAGEQNSVTFAASGGTVRVDTVTLGIGGLPITRAQMAARVERRITALAAEQSLSTAPSADGPEGDYSDAVDEALRQIGAVGRYGDPDVTRLTLTQVQPAVDGAILAMLEQLRVTYSLETDVSLGPRRESRSQIAGALGKMVSKGPGTVQVRRLIHDR